MAKRGDHKLMIEQGKSWATILLIDKEESSDHSFVRGIWKHNNQSYVDKEIKFSDDNSVHYYWEWRGPHAGTLSIGVKMNSEGSHKEGQGPWFQILITMNRARRMANGKFEVASALDTGTGLLSYNVDPHFSKGEILWSPTRYN